MNFNFQVQLLKGDRAESSKSKCLLYEKYCPNANLIFMYVNEGVFTLTYTAWLVLSS